MIQFTPLELDIAKEIVNIGLSKAADSLSFFTKEKVLIRGGNIQFRKLSDHEPMLLKESDPLVALSTELRGEVDGHCYLIFSTEEVDKLARIGLPPEIISNPLVYPEMRKAMLLEADNIITAAVVTQFSNLLQANMHGYVPFYHEGSKKEIEALMLSQARKGKYVLHFHAHLVSGGKDIAPEFMWCLDKSFVKSIQAFARHEENQKRLRHQMQQNNND